MNAERQTVESIHQGLVAVSMREPNTARFDTAVIAPGRFGSGTARAVTIGDLVVASLSAFVAGDGVQA